MEKLIKEIEQNMVNLLNHNQMEELHNVLCEVLKNNLNNNIDEELNYCEMFIYAKKVEGCSNKSLKYYKSTIDKMLKVLHKSVKQITTDDIRKYLGDYNKNNNCGKVTIDNIRRIISSFFFVA